MTYPADVGRPVVLRLKRDTLVLAAMATGLTLGLAHLVQAHRAPSAPDGPQQAWTGELSGLAGQVADASDAGATEPLTSASLVVPQSDFALPPQPPMRPLIKLRGCSGHSCAPRATPVAAASSRSVVESVVVRTNAASRRTKPALISRLNPLNHLPDASTIKRPFSFASDAVSGWFKRF